MRRNKFFVMALLAFSTLSAFSQRVTLSYKNQPLKAVLSAVSRQTGYSFMYSSQVINPNVRVSISIRGQQLSTALHKLLADTNIGYTVRGKEIILFNKGENNAVYGHGQATKGEIRNVVKIRGVVLDQKGMPVAGANVIDKENGNGAITDLSGRFELMAEVGQRLSVSYLGYETKTLTISGTEIQVKLSENIRHLSDLVVVGYGVQRKRDLTGTIATIKGNSLSDIPVAKVTDALQGMATGLDIVSDGGAPGADPVIRVRGTGSLNASNPLVVIDGIPAGDLSDVNANDIATIEVLKDASSSAIYGTRAANGVVIITTKRGEKNKKTKVEMNFYYGLSNISKTLDLLTAPELVVLKKERYANDHIPVNNFWNDAYYSTQRSDWQDAIFRQGAVYNVDVRLSGGGKAMNYMTSLGYYKEDGIVLESDFQRLSLRFNSDWNVSRRLKVSESIQYTYRNWSNPNTLSAQTGIVWEALRFNPAIPVRTDDGWGSAKANNELGDINNPVYELSTEQHSKYNHSLFAALALDLEIIKELHWKSNFAFDGSVYKYKDFYPKVLEQMRQRADADLTQAYENRYSFVGETYLSFVKEWRLHAINAVAGFSAQKNGGDFLNATKRGFADENVNQIVMDNGSSMNAINGNYYPESRLASFFSRLFYSYNNRYLATITFRADGSSKFAPGKQWGYFPAFSLGWRLSEEKFLKDIPFISSLKLIGGWGLLGNQDVADLQYLIIMKRNTDYGNKYTFGSQYVGGAKIASLANPDITWERTGMTNIGLEGSLLDSSLTFAITWFNKKTVDMLIPTVSLGSIGRATIPDSNIGQMRNRGWEIEVGFQQSLANGFHYNFGVNLSLLDNKILKLYGNNNFIGSEYYGRQNQEISRSYEGKPIASFYGWKTNGLYQNQSEINNDPNIKNDSRKSDITPGDVRFVDINGDGKIDENDRTYLGDPNPNVIIGFQTSISYKGFDFSMNWAGSLGAQLYNADRMQGLDPTYSYNMYSEALNRWHGSGTSNTIPKMSTLRTNMNFRTSDLFIENGDFLKLKTLTLGYSFPQKWMKVVKLSSIRVYMTAENLLTITSYSGYTPELGYTDGNKQRGVDYAQYPMNRKFTFGLKLNF